MFKRLLLALFGVALWGGTAMAQCATYTFPYTLTNGQTADASQVMANFAGINGCAAPLANPSFSGNVGIGTTGPKAALDLFGPVGAAATSGDAANGILRLENSTDSGIMAMGIQPSGTGAWLQSTDNTTYGSHYPLLLNPNGGNVGIATTAPSQAFYVNGQAGGSTTWNGVSDERLKTNVTPITDALGLVKRLRGVRYQWRAIEDRAIGKELTLSDGPQIGLIAQEVAAVVPEAVTVPAKGSNAPYGLKSADLIPILVEAVKQQQAEIEQLRASLAALKAGKGGAQ